MTSPKRALDDQDYAAFAWARYRRILKWMGLASAIAGLAAIAILAAMTDELHWLVALGAFVGVFLTVLMAAALMGLVFLSSGTGHDENAAQVSDADQRGWRDR
ncbi:hypothetical protein [Sphingomonas sp. AX6]|uniref:hypothetical protein n=1 Tax=Sphingomonas sp. AX6 TaxID=2653171 RepID=UPI0012F22954|nr:hypothetical protein [Sphingomonas sp. AX6]VXC71716.1 conserved hypothetical protein [Sphingomonas sp. AX6]